MNLLTVVVTEILTMTVVVTAIVTMTVVVTAIVTMTDTRGRGDRR
jgi:hypothetical protein